MNQNQKGFSLVELLVVVAIIGVLAGVGIVGYDRYVENTRQKVFLQNYETVKKAIDFEFLVAQNGLNSAIDEVDASTNQKTGVKVSSSTSCIDFLYSIQEHFRDFKNPWRPDKRSVGVYSSFSDEGKKPGIIQIVCYKGGAGYGTGSSCPIEKSRFNVNAFLKDCSSGSEFATGGHEGPCGGGGGGPGLVAGDREARKNYVIGGAWMSDEDGQMDCDVMADDDWNESIAVPTEVGY